MGSTIGFAAVGVGYDYYSNFTKVDFSTNSATFIPGFIEFGFMGLPTEKISFYGDIKAGVYFEIDKQKFNPTFYSQANIGLRFHDGVHKSSAVIYAGGTFIGPFKYDAIYLYNINAKKSYLSPDIGVAFIF